MHGSAERAGGLCKKPGVAVGRKSARDHTGRHFGFADQPTDPGGTISSADANGRGR